MQVVIDILEEEYEKIKSMYIHNNATAADLRRIIANGTPLPKEHGRLVDTDALKSGLEKHKNLFINAYGKHSNMPVPEKIRVDEITQCIAGIVNAPTIIEATKESE